MARLGHTIGRWSVTAVLLVTMQLAAAVEQKGVAEGNVGARASAKEKQAILDDALRNAVETWIAQKQSSHFKNYEQIKAEVNADIRSYVLRHQIIDEEKKQRVYRIVVRADLNEPKLLDKLLAPSVASSGGQQEFLTFVFVAREKIGTESVTEKQATQTKSQVQEIAKHRGESKAGQSKSKSQTIASRQVERNIADRTLWEVTTANEIDTAMGEVFTEAQYLVIDAALLEEETGHLLSVENFVEDYRHGDDLTPATKREAVKGLAALKDGGDPVNYLAIGTLDVGEFRKDDKTGNVRVAVAVTGQVLSIFQRGAAVAKVGPETMIGEGPSDLVAKNNALKAAAQTVADQLVAKLSARNIR